MIELVVIGATLAAAIGVSGARARRRAVAARVLRHYARSYGHTYAPPIEGRSSPRASGAAGEVTFVVDFCRLGAQLSTRVVAHSVRGASPRLRIVQRGILARTLGPPHEGTEGISDAARLERLFHVAAGDEELLRSIARPLARFGRRADVRMWSDGAKVTLTWSGLETDIALLEAAREAVVPIAAMHRPEAPYR